MLAPRASESSPRHSVGPPPSRSESKLLEAIRREADPSPPESLLARVPSLFGRAPSPAPRARLGGQAGRRARRAGRDRGGVSEEEQWRRPSPRLVSAAAPRPLASRRHQQVVGRKRFALSFPPCLRLRPTKTAQTHVWEHAWACGIVRLRSRSLFQGCEEDEK